MQDEKLGRGPRLVGEPCPQVSIPWRHMCELGSLHDMHHKVMSSCSTPGPVAGHWQLRLGPGCSPVHQPAQQLYILVTTGNQVCRLERVTDVPALLQQLGLHAGQLCLLHPKTRTALL